MFKIAISGKAGSGKDTVAKMLPIAYKQITGNMPFYTIEALANPIKEIVGIMFPNISSKVLYGPSENRSELVPNAYLNGENITCRRLLQHLGTEVCREYNKNIWLDVLDYRAKQSELQGKDLFIVSDCRFLNEFEYLKNHSYITIRIERKNHLNMTHSSEIDLDEIPNSEFDFVIDNNKSMEELNEQVLNILSKLI